METAYYETNCEPENFMDFTYFLSSFSIFFFKKKFICCFFPLVQSVKDMFMG